MKMDSFSDLIIFPNFGKNKFVDDCCQEWGETPPPPVGVKGGGDDLTSLNWLHSLDMVGMVPHLSTPPTPPASPPLNGSTTSDRKRKAEAVVKEVIDYSKDGSVKPPYSYAALIGMAMKVNENKMTLSAIYKWIKEHFIFYKTADASWQNSIRHNLSLNKCFLKVPRNKDEPGKGGFWKLDPDYADTLVDGVFKKRRPVKPTHPPQTKSKKNRRPHLGVDVKVVVQSVPPQQAFMPPPTNKPPPMSGVFAAPDSCIKDDLVWSSILGEEEVTNECWHSRTQELVTDLSHTGDPSTYPSTLTMEFQQQSYDHRQEHCGTELPSLELSPASLGVDEELFNNPDYSESSSDAVDSFTQYDLTGCWGDEKSTGHETQYGELPSMASFCNGLTQLTPLEPVASVVVQDVHACWPTEGGWDEAKTFSLLDVNLVDLENLIDLDVL